MAKKRRPASARSAAAKKGWQTRRANAREAALRSQRRSEAAQKGWAARRERVLIQHGQHPASARDWATLSKNEAWAVQEIADQVAGIPGRPPKQERLHYMRDWIEATGARKFGAIVRELERITTYTASQIRTAFFSPKAVRV